MDMSYSVTDRWAVEHRDCNAGAIIMDRHRAAFVLTTHAGHGPGCCQYLAALSMLSTVVG